MKFPRNVFNTAVRAIGSMSLGLYSFVAGGLKGKVKKKEK